MCSIAGEVCQTFNLLREQPVLRDRLLETMARRGPDQNGIYIEGDVVLLHARLSVVDLEHGRQPMVFAQSDARYVLVYNGELYNAPQLRQQLMQLGHQFDSHSDTEVLLHAYMQWKEKCLSRFNGIFAFAIWDKQAGIVFTARDRMGVKPFFFVHHPGCFLFASEMKTLLAHPKVSHAIGQVGLSEIMLIGPGRTPGCGVFSDIGELQMGQYGVYDLQKDSYEITTYWRLLDHPHTDTFDQTVEKVRYLVVDAIERQLACDVPVCTFLSGGLDSSIISAIADRYFQKKGMRLQTVSVDYKDNEKYFRATHFQPGSDASFILKMNDCLSAEHHLILLDTPQLVQALYTAVEARDLPGMADIDSSLLLFCQQIKPVQNIATVALSGECADEIFGGYPWYRDKEIREREGFPWAQSTAYRASFLKKDLRDKLNPTAYVDAGYQKTLQESDISPDHDRDETRMKQMVNLNFRWFMQTLLDRKDRMSMYSGLEVRVPFCDWRIAEYLYTVPWAFKDAGGYEKGLLRHAMEGLLPDEILWRKKSPYPKTWNPGYLQAVSNELSDVLADPASPILTYLDRDAMEGVLHTDRQVPWYGQLMTTPQTIAYLLQVNYWLKHYDVQVQI